MNIIEKTKLLFYINKLYKQTMEVGMSKNWKTTMAGVVATLGLILKLFKIDLPEEVSNGLIAIGVFAIGFFAKDSNVTGGAVQQ
jgi:hypothetical protein